MLNLLPYTRGSCSRKNCLAPNVNRAPSEKQSEMSEEKHGLEGFISLGP